MKKSYLNDDKYRIDLDPIDPDVTYIPEGDYFAEITDVETCNYKRIEGEYLKISFTVLRGPLRGVEIWEKFQLWHPTSKKAVNFARCQIKQLSSSVVPNDETKYPTHLVGKKVCLKTKELHGDEIYDKPYDIKEFFNPSMVKHNSNEETAFDKRSEEVNVSNITNIPW